MTLKRSVFGALAIVACMVVSTACASYQTIAVTTSPSVVANCQKVDDVSLPPDRGYDDMQKQLVELARAKGANTLLVPSSDPDERTGVAYRCSSPVAPPSPTS